jgi:hypothetical protein
MKRRRLIVLVSVALLIIVVALALQGPSTPPLTPAQKAAIAAARAAHRLLGKETNDVDAAKRLVEVALPLQKGAVAPAVVTPLFSPKLPTHEVWNFLPYYAVAGVTQAEIDASSAIIFSGLCIASNATIDPAAGECANDESALASGAFSSLVLEAHQVGTKVMLSLTAFSNATIASLLAHPKRAAATLSSTVLPIVATDHLDGINIDIEGSDPTEAGRFVEFTKAFTTDLRAGDPSGEIVLDAYAASASGDPNFFAISALAPYVDRVFAEAYQMDSTDHASPNSPLRSSSLGFSDVQTLVQYEQQMPARKLILGVPFYGLDFTTKNSKPGAAAITPAPESFTYDDIAAARRKALWDPASLTPYAVFRRDGGWHQLWYDDPVSTALKVALAVNMHAAGVGAWALGMETNSPSMLSALTGTKSPKRLVGSS